MDKNYNHKEQEDKIYQQWEESGLFSPAAGKDLSEEQKTFCIIMPPPNANDPLHVGHAMFVSLEDILIRYHRMKGEASLWLPGTDHAGIETQFVFEKKLAKEGKSRFNFDRETLYKMIWDYVQENSTVAVNQMKKLGASADWSRQQFTLNPEIVSQVLETFVKLHNDGLVYKGMRLVNYCTKCGTAYSELEVEHEERVDKLYEIKYGDLVVATTRPETMFGDIAVAVHPEDERYKEFIGKKVKLPLTDREIPVIADKMVDMEFGTGVVKITPAHDNNDWDATERAGMEVQKLASEFLVIGQNGKMTEKADKYAGLNIMSAREEVVKDLGDLLVSVKPHSHNVGTCYRCHRVIEPLPMSQFFIKTKPLAEKVLEALDSKETKILGSGREKILRHWLVNIKDWNVSRQIVWGIQLPVWYKDGDQENYKVSIESPGEGWIQETDTFDTWFSSGQWPVATLKAGKKGDFEKYYPTTVMETGYDILPFWVMRMMMLGIYLTGKSPFKYVYLHGLVRDESGRKMSKSVGNVINPLDLIEKYGTDALRMALVMSTVPGMDSNTGENKVRGMRNFDNKIWNAGRYVKEVMGKEEVNSGDKEEKNKEVREHLDEVVKEVTKLLDNLKLGMATERAYNEFWHWYCDEVIEWHKEMLIDTTTLSETFKTMIKLLHPFVPFVTESLWKEVFEEKKLLLGEVWPKSS